MTPVGNGNAGIGCNTASYERMRRQGRVTNASNLRGMRRLMLQDGIDGDF